MPTSNLTIYAHPLVQSRLTRLRAAETPTSEFRPLLRQLATSLTSPVFARLPTEPHTVQTPLAPCEGRRIRDAIVLIPILRAGLGLLDGMLEMVPEALVGHLGMYRNEETLQPIPYYTNLPAETRGGFVVICDPMLATGHSALYAIETILPHQPARIVLATILASPEGIRTVHAKQPEVEIVTLAVDRRLNEKGYIVPGLGDAGDRYFGTA